MSLPCMATVDSPEFAASGHIGPSTVAFHVLIVEDDTDLREMLAQFLTARLGPSPSLALS